VTDHVAKADKLVTHSSSEDLQFYQYKQKLAEYNKAAVKPSVPAPKRKYEVGSLAQRIFDPLAGAKRDQNGTLIYTVEDKEINYRMDEDRLRRLYDLYTN
jgi:beta-lactamase superfamily II metal-dependent hydrolase